MVKVRVLWFLGPAGPWRREPCYKGPQVRWAEGKVAEVVTATLRLQMKTQDWLCHLFKTMENAKSDSCKAGVELFEHRTCVTVTGVHTHPAHEPGQRPGQEGFTCPALSSQDRAPATQEGVSWSSLRSSGVSEPD